MAIHKRKKRVVAIGFFDGLHRGHQKLIAKLFDSENSEFEPAVFTYKISKARPGLKSRALIMTQDEKIAKLNQMGVSLIFSPDFEEFFKLTPAEFVERFLFRWVDARKVVVGEDFRFGFQKEGDVSCLVEICKKYGIEVVVVANECFEGRKISSSWIAELLQSGNTVLAEKLLDKTLN